MSRLVRLYSAMLGLIVWRNSIKRLGRAWLALVVGLAIAMPLYADSRSWTFTTETVDVSTGFTSLMADSHGNVHLAYTNPGFLVSYAFRDVQTSKWFHIVVDRQASFTSLTLDSQENPHICYTQRDMHYAHWDGKKWQTEQIAQGAGAIAYSCSVAISSDGVPHVTW